MDQYSGKNKFGSFHKPTNLEDSKKKSKEVSRLGNDSKLFERGDLFDRQWAAIEREMLAFSSSLFEQYVDKLYNFIDSHIMMYPDDETRQKLIPSAIIALSSKNTQQRVSNEIDNLLTLKESPIKTIHLDSFQATNMSTLFQAFFSSLKSEIEIELNDLKNFSFAELMSMWIEEHTISRPSLAILFHHFENFDKALLSKLVCILKEYTEQVSIVFVFMIFNEINSSLQFVLPAHITDCLLIEHITPFYEPKLLPHIFKEFITNPQVAFKIHPALIKKIDALFSKYEYSFPDFLYFIKSLIVDHFYENPLSTIYDLDSMKRENEEVFRNSLNIDFDNDNYLENVHHSYKSLLKEHEHFCLNIEIISSFKKYCLIDEQHRFVCLYSDILNNELDIKGYFYPLLKVNENNFQSAINKTLEEFVDFKNNHILRKIINFRHDLENMIAKESEENREQEILAKKKNLDYDGSVELQKTKLRGLNARVELRRNLIMSIQDSQKLSSFEKLKRDFVQDLIANFENHPLVEQSEMINSLFYSNTDLLTASLSVSIRENIDAAYSIKHHADKSGDNLVIYRLYKEAGKIFNLHEIYMKFCNERKLDMSEDESIVRFSIALSDLEYIGLVQPSKKADFMNKINWL